MNKFIPAAVVLLTLSAGAGQFQATDESLKQYACPDWFRDAKLGIWAVWGPESVPMQGDWYARKLYEEGGRHYKYHVEHYGHPSKVGFKDIIPLWKAEKWEPDRLMELYKKAGAKYFCMIAEHHDNFDCWDSKFQKWNSVNMGPKRDIAGEWKQAATKQGLRFGMTEHLAPSWWFYGAAKGADTNGPIVGVPYDGADPRFADLYWSGNEKPTFHYYGTNVPVEFKQAWFNRINDMVDRYHPDLLYSDSPLPYPDEVGRQLLAHYYNDNMQQHGGRLEAIYNCKQDSQGRWVQDLERGVMDGISPFPWQTDTCVGGWYYDEKVLEHHGYKTPATVIHMLCDIVSKNGNLLLNFPPRPDGTLDDDELKILEEMAEWIAVNGEAIYGTRPWKVYGEGPSKAQKGGNFNEGKLKYTAGDIRFTTKGETLYAIALGWPENGKLTVRSLASVAGKIAAVSLLGYDGKLEWNQTGEGLTVILPENKPCELAWTLKIAGQDLKPVSTELSLTPQKMQNPVVLNPKTINCLLAGDGMRTPGIHERAADSKLEAKHYWLEGISGEAKVTWNLLAEQAGDYRVTFILECAKGTEITVTGPNNSFVFSAPENGWQRSASQDVLKLNAGISKIIVQVKKFTINFKGIDLINTAEEQDINRRILAFKGDTSWMKEAGYGIMVQGGGWAYPPKGDKKPWPGFAEDFDAKAFVSQVDEMGGKYLVWSATWHDFLISAPIKSIAEILPQRVSNRDLIGDLIEECKKHNIRFMMYYHLGHNNKDVLLAKGWKDAGEQDFTARSVWLDREAMIFTEMGKRYGSGLDAIFLDDACVWYPADFEKLGAALKAGNPKRVICYNPWILPSVTPFQDFWCGEGFTGEQTPYSIEDGVVAKGPQQGLQLFGNFMFDGPDWGIYKPEIVIQNTRWTSEQIVSMVHRLEKERYSVAINLLMYEDGSMNPFNVGILKETAQKLKRGNQK